MKYLRKYIQLIAIVSVLLLVVNYCEAQNNSISFSVKTTDFSPVKGHSHNYDYMGYFPDSIFYNQKLPNYISKQFLEQEYKVYNP